MSNLMPEGRSERPGPDSGFTNWTKSSLSFANGNCVEVANLPGGQVGVRDSKDAAGQVLRFTPDEWHAFLGGVRNGEFDRFGKLDWLARLLFGMSGPGPGDLHQVRARGRVHPAGPLLRDRGNPMPLTLS